MHRLKVPKKTPPDAIVGRWLKSQGQMVKQGDCLLEIETPQAIVEIETGLTGQLLKFLAPEGSAVQFGTTLALIGEPGEDVGRLGEATVSDTKEKEVAEMAEPAEVPAAQAAGNVVPILMPQAGQSMEEGTVLSWKVKPGDSIEVGQIIMEIETDKATMDVEAVDAGRLARIVVQEGETVDVKVAVAYLAEQDSDVDAYLGSPAPAAKSEAADPAKPAEVPAAQVSGNVIPILMPQAGQSMEEGTILSWKIKPGDSIEVGQVIMEIETDKATMDVEAVDGGRLARIVVQEGETVDVKVPVAYIAEQDSEVDAYLSAQAPAAKAETPAPTVQQKSSAPQARQVESAKTETGRIRISPAARKLAAERGIDPASIAAGSGPGGRIVLDDIKSAEPAEKAGQLSKMRRAIAANLLYSKQNIPHFYGRQTIRADAMFDLYKQTKERFKCSVNDLVVAACAKAVRQWPVFRSRFADDRIIELPDVNVGIAVGTDDGLVVPVLVGADEMDFETLASKGREIIEAARGGKIMGLGKGVFTVTNLGMFGLDEFMAIINPPESAILAVGAIREDVAVVDGKIQPAKLMTFNLSVDHRVIDGVMAAKFLQTLKELLEDPQQLI